MDELHPSGPAQSTVWKSAWAPLAGYADTRSTILQVLKSEEEYKRYEGLAKHPIPTQLDGEERATEYEKRTVALGRLGLLEATCVGAVT